MRPKEPDRKKPGLTKSERQRLQDFSECTSALIKAPPSLPTQVDVSSFSLQVVGGDNSGLEWTSKGKKCSIGAHPSNDLVLNDRTVSRFHCEIELGSAGALMTDLDSRNGTQVDGVQAKQVWLRDHSFLILGATTVRFRLAAETNPILLSSETQLGTMVGSSVSMRAAFAEMEAAAATDATVLVEGETGTGKEEAAVTIHELSQRREKPFVVVDCGAIPSSLLESELFGHKAGAFTGATTHRDGAFQAASNGTIFLDEIGELPLELQPKLLRAIDKKTIRPLGGTQQKKVNLRVIAATNRDLRTEVNEKRFRSDLYYRLAVVQITLPPLRTRPEDIPQLVEHILHNLGAEEDVIASVSSEQMIERLKHAAWVGNVRELRNYLERCAVFHQALPLGEAAPQHLSERAESVDYANGRLSWSEARRLAVEDFEQRYIEALLQVHDGNVSKSARTAGMNRAYLYRLMERHDIRR